MTKRFSGVLKDVCQMNRRSLLKATFASVLPIAGCTGSPARTKSETVLTRSPTETATRTPSPTDTESPTPPPFQPIVNWATCSEVVVKAARYDLVALSLHGGNITEFRGSFEGVNTFSTNDSDAVITAVYVYRGDKSVHVKNPLRADCLSTPTDTPTETQTPTETASPTQTPSPTPTPAPEVHITSQSYRVHEGTPDEELIIEGEVENLSPYDVSVSIYVMLYANADPKVSLGLVYDGTLTPGEKDQFSTSYDGEYLDDIDDYEINKTVDRA